MIDTIRLVIPIQHKDIYLLLRSKCKKIQLQENRFLYSAMNLNFHDYEMNLPSHATGLNIQVLENQINVEGSIPKNLLGNNIDMIQAKDIQIFLNLTKDYLEKFLNTPPSRLNGENHSLPVINLSEWDGGAIKLLPTDYWRLQRIDLCFNWHLENQLQVIEYINAFKRFTGGMKDTTDYQERGMEVRKKEYKIKLYNKFLEYLVHDHKKLIKENPDVANELIEESKGVLRFEIGLRKKQIEYEFGITDRTWGNVKKFFQDNNKTLELLDRYLQKITNKMSIKVLTKKEIYNNLEKLYGHKMATKLWGFYQLIDNKEAMQKFPRKTKYRYRQQLKKAQLGLVSEIELPPLQLPPYTPTPKTPKTDKLLKIWKILKS